MATIKLENVSKSFGGAAAVRGVDLEIGDREFVAFVGPSGCGKSTLLRLIAGLEAASAGRILIDGEDQAEVPPAKRGLAMVFQSYALYPHMTVYDNIAFPLRMSGERESEIDRKVRDAARTLNLTDLLRRKPRQLSGGQRQRVAIGRAIGRSPRAFLFDEPLSNLDAALRVNMRFEIGALHRRLGATTAYVTHDQTEAMTMADRVVALNAGRVEQVGTPLDLYRRPANLFVAGFIGSPRMNFIGGESAAADGAKTLGVRPEHFSVSAESGRWRGEVAAVERLGADAFLHVEVSGVGRLTARVDGESAAGRGARVFLTPAAGKTRRFDAAGRAIDAD